MSANRKAELQRKLAMAPVPTPPAGLAERIKSEIPENLKWDAEKERQRFSRSVAFNLRVAASILLLISSVYLALHVVSRYEKRTPMLVPEAASARVKANVDQQPRAQSAPVAQPQPAVVATSAPMRVAEAQPIVTARRTEEAPAVETPPPPSMDVNRDVPTQVAQSRAPEPPVPLPVAPPAAAAAAPPVAESITITAEAPMMKAERSAKAGGVIPEARADDLSLAPPPTLFGVSLKTAVQQFAAPSTMPSSVRLDVEAAMIDDRPTLRISIDTPDEAHPDGGSRPPAAADARLEIAFNPEAVASQRPLIGPIASSATALPSSESVTALYGLELKPDVRRSQVVATVTLHYRDVESGKQHTLSRTVHRADIRQWERASRRTKSAILAEAVSSKQLPLDDIIERANAAGLTDVAAYAEQQRQ